MAKAPSPSVDHRRSSRLVLWMDSIAHFIITIGGIATIAAVLMVFFFLCWVVWPMFAPADTHIKPEVSVSFEAELRYMGLDDDQNLLWSMYAGGKLDLLDVKSGEVIDSQHLFDQQKPTSLRYYPVHDLVVAGFADGSLRMSTIRFTTIFHDDETVGDAWQDMQEEEFRRRDQGYVFKTPTGQWRQTDLTVTREDPLKTSFTSPIKMVDMVMSTSGPVITTYSADHRVAIHKIVEKTNFMTMKKTRTLKSRQLPYTFNADQGQPYDSVLIGQGQYLLLLWQDGYSERYNLINQDITLAEKSRLNRRNSNGEARGAISAVGRFLGRNTVLLGYENGDVSAWFLAQPDNAETIDKRVWQEGHVFPGDGHPVSMISSSVRQRLALFADKGGHARLVHVTSERMIYDGKGVEGADCLAIAPKDDGFVIAGNRDLLFVALEAQHPDVTLASLFLPVWYEGYVEPETVWQSSSASDDAEAKLGLWPLIFGTLKGTFYSLIFGVPIALAAAVYSSEFMSPRLKNRVKPAIEMMASLPSVVLGFLGGIIISVWMKEYVVSVMAAIFIVPLTVAGAAYVAQLFPRHIMMGLMRWRIWIIAIPCFAVGWLLSIMIGHYAEDTVFGGDFIKWLQGYGSPFGGLWYLCLPVSIIIVLLVIARWVKPLLIDKLRGETQVKCAVIDFAKFFVSIAAVIGIAAALAALLMLTGLESRSENNVFGVYDKRNALVVGFMMAFAIIPIIYTIADDALSAVPSHLRAASLGSGATIWQTAMRVVVPTAMSGLFSAVMVGLGRAIGETMIMLMVAGNTPTKDWNIFSGFKTLSANIASELPESVHNSTHYRTLFLSALVLFLMTFVLNTFAEWVRTKYRKKAVSL